MAKKATKAAKEPKKAAVLVDDLVELNDIKGKKSKKKLVGDDDIDGLDEVVIDPEVHEMEEDESTYEMGKIQVADADTDEEKVDLAKIPTDTLDGEVDDLTEAADEGTITIDEDPYLDAENFDGDNPDEEYYN
jgi:hypothetical protein